MAQTYALHQAFLPAGHMTILQLFLVNWCWLDFLHLCIVAAFWWIHHLVVWVLLFLFRFWTYSGILVHSVTELYIELGPLCCLHIVSFFLLALDGGVRCFWWWRDNNAMLHIFSSWHFSSICFFISMLADNAFSFANLASKGFCPASDSFLNQSSKTFL